MSLLLDCIKSRNELVHSVIFPGSIKSQSTYHPSTFSKQIKHQNCKLIYIPIQSNTIFTCMNELPRHIPMLWIWPSILKTNEESSDFDEPRLDIKKPQLVIIFFHGNASDISQSFQMGLRMSYIYHVHFLIIEYPRYGFADGHPSEEAINLISCQIFDFVTDKFRISSNQIIIFGNSIGTGPTCYLSNYCSKKKKKLAGVILHAPYVSLHDIADDVIWCLPYLFLNRWDSFKYIIDPNVMDCPVLFIHADNDEVINFEHSKILHSHRCKLGLASTLFTQESTSALDIKSHNTYKYIIDLENPIASFIKTLHSDNLPEIEIDLFQLESYSTVPPEYVYLYEDPSLHRRFSLNYYARWCTCPIFCLSECMISSCYRSLTQLDNALFSLSYEDNLQLLKNSSESKLLSILNTKLLL